MPDDLPSPPQPAQRERRRRGSLTPELILDAAEAVAEEGFDALSMRRVAAQLGAVPMALYNHFATKEQLVDALLDRVLSRFEPETPTNEWTEDLGRFARAHRRLLNQHPWAVAPLFTQPNPGLGSVRIGELGLRILRRGGFSDARAVAAFSGLIALNYGWASFTSARALDAAAPGHAVAAMLAGLPRREYPMTVEVSAEMGRYGSDEHYDFVLDRFLEGLRAAAEAGVAGERPGT
jgi:AcrR family transcriptional regulator